MKYILALALFSPLFLAAQDTTANRCKLDRQTDPFTKETKLSTGFIGMDGGSVTIDANSTEIDFLFSIEGVDRCFDNNSMAAIFFEGTKLKMTSRNGGSMNCEGLFHFIFRNTATTTSLLSRITSQKVNHFVFTCTSKKDVTVTLSPADQQTLIALANCLVNEAKTLIK